MSARCYWPGIGREPGLAELLADPIVTALMQADGIAARDVLAAIPRRLPPACTARETVTRRPEAKPVACRAIG